MSPDWLTPVRHLPTQPLPAWTAAAAAALAALAAVLAGRRRTPGRTLDGRGRRTETMLTVAAAGIATGVSASGMWRVFGDALGMSGPARAAVFGFAELAVAVSAIRARRALRETGTTGVDGAAVWALAGLSAVLSASDARRPAAVLLRLAAPLVAAWLWERGLAPDRRQHTSRPARQAIGWRITRQRLLVWLRLAEPAQRTGRDLDTARRTTQLVRAAWRYHTLTAAGAAGWRTRRAARLLRRRTLTAVEHHALGTNTAARDTIRHSLATVYQVADGTAPRTLADLTPWSTPPAPADSTAATPTPPPEPAPQIRGMPAPAGEHTAGPAGSVQPPAAPHAVQLVQRAAVQPPPVQWAFPAAPAATQHWPGRADGDRTAPAVRPPHPPADGDPARAEPHARPADTGPGLRPGRQPDGQSARARRAALTHREASGTLPTATELVRLTGVSRGTAGTVLKRLRHTTTPPTPNISTPPADKTHTPENQITSPRNDHLQHPAGSEPEQQPTPHEDHPTHLTNKITNQYTPTHHDPQEDQQPVGEDRPAAVPGATTPAAAADPVGVVG